MSEESESPLLSEPPLLSELSPFENFSDIVPTAPRQSVVLQSKMPF